MKMWSTLLLLVAGLALAAGAPQSLTQQDGAPTLPGYKCGVEDGTFMDPEQCDMYWTCEGGTSTRHYCDDGLVFDRFKGLAGQADPCDSPYKVDCSERPYLQEPTNPTPECVRRHGTFEDPDPTVCNRFHVCKSGAVEETLVCVTNLHFNPETGNCEWPLSAGRTGCSNAINNCLPNDKFCCHGEEVINEIGQNIPHPTYPDPEDCQKFYVCLSKVTPQASSCNAGEVYNINTTLCDLPENVPDCYGWYRDDPRFAEYYDYADVGTDAGAQDTPV